jgi:hypothetical protein
MYSDSLVVFLLRASIDKFVKTTDFWSVVFLIYFEVTHGLPFLLLRVPLCMETPRFRDYSIELNEWNLTL